MKTAIKYLPVLIVLLAWELVGRFSGNSALPTLTSVMSAWTHFTEDGDLAANGAVSMYRLIAGLGLAILVGTVFGTAMAWWKPVDAFLKRPLEVLYPLPKSALIPVAALWLGFGDASKIVLIFLGCLVPITLGAFNGARSSDRTLIWSARCMGASRLRVLWDVAIPSALPELLSGIRTALALSFVLLVSSELIASRKGFGYMIGLLGASGAYEQMFAVVATVATIGFLADRLYLLLVRRIMAWQL